MLALFDLDNTLLEGDSDYAWGQFLVRRGLVDGVVYERENQRYYDQYRAGTLDIQAFLRFSLAPLAAIEPGLLQTLREAFLNEQLLPMVKPGARALLDHHRACGHRLVLVTATNSFITRPIADTLGIEHLLATEPEQRDERFTGHVAGIPCFREGKVARLRDWMALHQENLDGSWFYSDSHNDLPLLRVVSHPVAVDPDDLLALEAGRQGWPVRSLRSP